MKPLINTSKPQYAKPVMLLIALGMLLSIWSCHEDPAVPPEPIEPIDLLPPLTTEGANKFGALVNGTPVFNRSTSLVFAQYPSARYLQFGGTMKNDTTNQSMGFTLNQSVENGEVLNLMELLDMECGYTNRTLLEIDFSNSCAQKDKSNLISGEVEIVYINIVDRVVAGRFEMTFVEDGCDTIKITDGRFDAIIQFM